MPDEEIKRKAVNIIALNFRKVLRIVTRVRF